MATGSQRYRGHKVWDTLELKRESLRAARYDDDKSEQWREDIIEWLSEAAKSKGAHQPALYLSALDRLSEVLNDLPVSSNEFKQYVGTTPGYRNSPAQVRELESALRALPLPPPKDLKDTYVHLLDQEVEARTARLDGLEKRVAETESALAERLKALEAVSNDLEGVRDAIKDAREAIAAVSSSAENKIDAEWDSALTAWKLERETTDAERDAEALAHVATLAATAKAGEALAEHAAGALSASDWYGRGKRERRAAQWMRAAAALAFLGAGAVGWFIVAEAIRNDFDLTVGDGILRSTVALVLGAFGGLLLRESGRHFREADTAEDVALALKALAPFYANSGDAVRLEARRQVGDAVLVRNVLSRFAHRDATKHAADVNVTELPGLVEDATKALKGVQGLGNDTK